MQQYKATNGETWDLIAWNIYGTEWASTDIIEANPRLAKIVVFSGGEIVYLPEETSVTKNDTLPPWRR